MPYASRAQKKYFNANRAKLEAQGVDVDEWNRASKGKKLPARVKKKAKAKVTVNNKMRSFGQMNPKTNEVEINVKKHKGDKKQLADTIKHELYHVKHPKAKEKAVYKNTGKLENMSKAEQDSLIAKLRMKKINYKGGAVKRKLKLKGEAKPGDMITEMNEQKRSAITNNNQSISKERLAIMGLV